MTSPGWPPRNGPAVGGWAARSSRWSCSTPSASSTTSLVGFEASKAGGGVWSPGGRQRRRTTAGPGDRPFAARAVRDKRPGRRAGGALSTGQRRLVEQARCLGRPVQRAAARRALLRLDHRETETFGEILKRVVAERGGRHPPRRARHGPGHGRLRRDLRDGLRHPHLFAGTPDQVRRSDIVRAAYLGTDAPRTSRGQRPGTAIGIAWHGRTGDAVSVVGIVRSAR